MTSIKAAQGEAWASPSATEGDALASPNAAEGGAAGAGTSLIDMVFILRGPQGLETKIINNEQRHPGKCLKAAFIGSHGAGGGQTTQKLGLGGEDDIVSLADRRMAKGLGEMTLAGAAGAGDEAGGGKVHDKSLVNGGVEIEIKLFNGLL